MAGVRGAAAVEVGAVGEEAAGAAWVVEAASAAGDSFALMKLEWGGSPA